MVAGYVLFMYEKGALFLVCQNFIFWKALGFVDAYIGAAVAEFSLGIHSSPNR